MVSLYNDDCLNVLKNIEDESIDLIVTDCPYRTISGSKNEGKSKAPSGILTKNDGKFFNNNDIKFGDYLPDFYRILKDGTHCYIMINARNLKDLQVEAEKAGFIFQNLLVWNKGNVTPNKYYMQGCEFILMLRKGKARTINNAGTKNILDIPNIIGNKQHPTEKPVELIQILIENSTKENDLVLDCFMGAGSTGVACKKTNRNFIGVEIDKKYFDIAKQRIDAVE